MNGLNIMEGKTEDLNRLTLAINEQKQIANGLENCIKEVKRFLAGMEKLTVSDMLTFMEPEYCKNMIPFRHHFEEDHASPYRVACETCVNLLTEAKSRYETDLDLSHQLTKKLMSEHREIHEGLFGEKGYGVVCTAPPIGIEVHKLAYGHPCEYQESLYIKVNKHKKYQNYDLTWTKSHCILMNLKLGTLRAVRYNATVIPKKLICEVYPVTDLYEDEFLKS